MAESNREENGDRLDELDLLRNALGANNPPQSDNQNTARLDELESQMHGMREEIRAQGNEVQSILNQKIDEILQALQISQFQSADSSPITTTSPIRRSPDLTPTTATNSQADSPITPQVSPLVTTPSPAPTAIETDLSETNEQTIDNFTDTINAILAQENNATSADSPPPSAAVTFESSPSPTPSPAPISEILTQENKAILKNFAPPTTPTINVASSPAPTPSTAPAPQNLPTALPNISPPQARSTSSNLSVIAEDEAARMDSLRDVLHDDDVMQLRQVNEKLDYKLRQVEEYLATSQQPMQDLLPLMTELVQLKIREAKSTEAIALPTKRRGTPWWAIFSFLLLLILVPLGLYGYWLRREYLLERDMAIALTATPELALYRLGADVQGNELYLTGKLPNETLKNRATAIAANTLPNLELNNNIVVLDPSLRNDEIKKILDSFNAVNGIQVTSELDGDRLTLSGTVLQEDDIFVVIQALEQISGINQITNNIRVQSQPVGVRLYFDQNSASIKPDDF
ncbi:MAG: BON domain-containing protein, partial [Limnothrix sp.]